MEKLLKNITFKNCLKQSHLSIEALLQQDLVASDLKAKEDAISKEQMETDGGTIIENITNIKFDYVLPLNYQFSGK